MRTEIDMHIHIYMYMYMYGNLGKLLCYASMIDLIERWALPMPLYIYIYIHVYTCIYIYREINLRSLESIFVGLVEPHSPSYRHLSSVANLQARLCCSLWRAFKSLPHKRQESLLESSLEFAACCWRVLSYRQVLRSSLDPWVPLQSQLECI